MFRQSLRLTHTLTHTLIKLPSSTLHTKLAPCRTFHASRRLDVIKPFLLADIGEGIRECEIIQWFVEPGAKVEQFDNICEVQSDKASVEISSRYDGIIKKLYYEAGDMAIVGKPLVDIDMVDKPASDGDAPTTTVSSDAISIPPTSTTPETKTTGEVQTQTYTPQTHVKDTAEPSGRQAGLATPAVRRLIREHGLTIRDIKGSGKDGRVMKDDVAKYASSPSSSPSRSTSTSTSTSPLARPTGQTEQTISLTPIQSAMFKTMTKSLTIPHFLYADEVYLDPLSNTRNSINSSLPLFSPELKKISYMPFFIKALSLSLLEYPLINSRLDLSDAAKPKIVMRGAHNIGVAMDTPTGLIVPNIKNVEQLSILEIAGELNRLTAVGREGKLKGEDLKGGTVTVSNIGNVGGTYLAPVVVTGEVAILGIGRAQKLPRFDEEGRVVPKTIVNFSWSADHRILDGSTMARMASLMKRFVEEPELMTARMR